MKMARTTATVLTAVLMTVAVLRASTKSTKDNAIKNTTQAFAAAWNRADSKAMSETFTPDASLVIPEGVMIQGRSAIEDFYRDVFIRGYGGSRAASSVKQIRYLRDDIAVVDGEWNIEDAHDPSGGLRSPERGIFCAVLVHSKNKWLIFALRERTSAAEIKLLNK